MYSLRWRRAKERTKWSERSYSTDFRAKVALEGDSRGSDDQWDRERVLKSTKPGNDLEADALAGMKETFSVRRGRKKSGSRSECGQPSNRQNWSTDDATWRLKKKSGNIPLRESGELDRYGKILDFRCRCSAIWPGWTRTTLYYRPLERPVWSGGVGDHGRHRRGVTPVIHFTELAGCGLSDWEGYRISRWRVGRLMTKMGLEAIGPKPDTSRSCAGS